ncbi:hypothetical protein EHF33_15770 [Deinococcus psychrotolerans]|uniref:Uncharacterized protein n=1 Tax=Deinococcus psychrotolerans TaxID=2489213 RepID=A0A3G8YGC2_9DEIO|nr:hypothetical protein [Deinococcus psychrotolerans]AZI44342.1 hypothetical protein EHF33_15770 [Deinococcus psychrotolerans]
MNPCGTSGRAVDLLQKVLGQEELGFDLKVMRDLDLLMAQAVEAAAPNTPVLELQYAVLASAPDPVVGSYGEH